MFKGFIRNKKKDTYNSANPILAENIFVVDKPFVETDPTVPTHIKAITTQDVSNWITGFNNNVISGSVTGDTNKILTLTKRDGTTLSIPFNDLQGLTTDDVINTLSFNSTTGVMTAVTSEGVQITTNLDGRYSLLDHTHSQYLESETDPTVPTHVKSITTTDKSNWTTGFNKRITGLAITGTSTKTITITLADNTTVVGSFTDISSSATTADGNDYVTGGNFDASTGQVTLTRIDGGTVVFNLDGRYEPSFNKLSAFNKNFAGNGVATTVARSDHSHIKTVIESGDQDFIYNGNTSSFWYNYSNSLAGGVSITLNSGAALKDTEMEGSYTGTVKLTINGGTGVSIIVPSGLTNTIPPNGVFGIKFIANNIGVLFGTLISV